MAARHCKRPYRSRAHILSSSYNIFKLREELKTCSGFFFIRGATSFLVDMVEGCRVSIGRNYFPLLIHGFKLMIKLTKIRCIDSCKKKKKRCTLYRREQKIAVYVGATALFSQQTSKDYLAAIFTRRVFIWGKSLRHLITCFIHERWKLIDVVSGWIHSVLMTPQFRLHEASNKLYAM